MPNPDCPVIAPAFAHIDVTTASVESSSTTACRSHGGEQECFNVVLCILHDLLAQIVAILHILPLASASLISSLQYHQYMFGELGHRGQVGRVTDDIPACIVRCCCEQS